MAGEEAKQGTGGGPDRVAGLKSRVDVLADLTRQLAASRIAAKRTRIGMLIVILLVFLGFGLVIFQMVHSFNTNLFMAEAKARMLQPKAGTMLALIESLRRCVPVYQEALQKQFTQEWPNIQKKLQSEGELFVKDVTEQTQTRLQARLDKLAARQKDMVFAEFPELKDEKSREIVMTNLEKALQGAVVDVLHDRVSKAEKRLLDVHDRIAKLLPPDQREGFRARWSKVWDRFIEVDLKGAVKLPAGN